MNILKVYDTSALLTLNDTLQLDENCYISLIVIGELENIKTSAAKDEEVKQAARKVVNIIKNSKCLTTVFSKKDYDSFMKKYSYALEEKNDTRIIFEAGLLSQKNKVIFHTGDYAQYLLLTKIFPQIEAHLFSKESKERFWDGYQRIIPTEKQWDDLYNITCHDNIFNLDINEYGILTDPDGKEHIVRWDGKEYVRLGFETLQSNLFGKIKPRSDEQQVYADLLQNPAIPIISCFGRRGSGKTFLAIATGLTLTEKGQYDKVLYLRNNWSLKGSQEIGYLPGTAEEKIYPYCGPVIDVVGGPEIFDELMERGVLDFFPLNFIRGRSLNNVFCVCDEAQNLTREMLAAIVSRIGENSKLVLCSDYKQIDNKLFERSNGVLRMNKVYRGNPLYGQVRLEQVERSKVCELAELLD